uniref:Alpha-tubulin N-acetyltransferase n=1 Tax=Heterorhabditis bacteriophora TaxID=37862 RepID=A0A1I7XA46_HETBA
MEIAFDFSEIFPNEPIQQLDRGLLVRCNPRKYWAVQKAIDQLGELSAKAQGLKRVLTSYEKILDHDEEQTLYIMWHKHENKQNTSVVIGLLKVGRKKLYLLDSSQQQFEEKPLCILDFYVHELVQRKGNGHLLYNYMLNCEAMSAGMVAIDRPSDAFLQFLQKFYGLVDPILVWQSTNFVVYPQFFEGKKPVTHVESRVRCNHSEKVDPCLIPPVRSRGKDWNDSAGGIIHGTSELPARREAGPDTPLDRKNKRDFGHQSIW